MRRLVHITTVAHSLGFLRGQPALLREAGIDVQAITSPGPRVEAFANELEIPVHTVEMPRRITPGRDLLALRRLVELLHELQPDIVHAHTPKAGLLGMISATLAAAPVRIYHLRGLPFETAKGWKRSLLITTELVSCTLAHRVIAVGHHVRDTAIQIGVCRQEKIKVLGNGSGQGVDIERFDPERFGAKERRQIRADFGIPDDALVIGFVGRIVRDKGVITLAEAWKELREEFPNAHLFIVGPFETRDPVPDVVRAELTDDPRVHLTGFVSDTVTAYAAMDIFTLPTYREGFPNAPLEAAAMGLPTVVSDIAPCREAIQDNVTGSCFSVGDTTELKRTLRRYLADATLRRDHGAAGRARVLRDFDSRRLREEILSTYNHLLSR